MATFEYHEVENRSGRHAKMNHAWLNHFPPNPAQV